MIPVTQPFLPPVEEYNEYIKSIWERKWLTNNGPLVVELENKIKQYLGVDQLLFLANGTIALQIALKALGLQGEIITTPFSYVATTSSIVWEGCTPVFADIDPNTLNIDPEKIKLAITNNTVAILATHVYGNPCDITAIEKIAMDHNLKVIYDAAHCFGTKYMGKSIFSYGDISTTSTHATKLFHSTEGGAVFTNNPTLLNKMSFMRNFGHNGPEQFFGIGINGKNSEFHAAMGLVNLNYVDEIIKQRKYISDIYKECLYGLNISYPQITENTEFNYAYFPAIFMSEKILLDVMLVLQENGIGTRRYFYPTLNKLPYIDFVSQPIAEDISKRILCLPLYYDLSKEDIHLICSIIRKSC